MVCKRASDYQDAVETEEQWTTKIKDTRVLLEVIDRYISSLHLSALPPNLINAFLLPVPYAISFGALAFHTAIYQRYVDNVKATVGNIRLVEYQTIVFSFLLVPRTQFSCLHLFVIRQNNNNGTVCHSLVLFLLYAATCTSQIGTIRLYWQWREGLLVDDSCPFSKGNSNMYIVCCILWEKEEYL